MKTDSKQSVPSLLTTEQMVANEDEEIYILKVPNTLSSSSILTLDMNLKSPNTRVFVQDKEFSPLLAKVGETRNLVGQNDKDKYSPAVDELKGIVTLRESVKVPPIPIVKIPPPYKVPHPQNLVTRHPIYGRVGLEQNFLKRKREDVAEIKNDDSDVEPVKKKKKKKNKVKETEVTETQSKVENNNVVETLEDNKMEHTKKKKKKDKDIEEVKEIEQKEREERICDTKKSKKKKKHKNKTNE